MPSSWGSWHWQCILAEQPKRSAKSGNFNKWIQKTCWMQTVYTKVYLCTWILSQRLLMRKLWHYSFHQFYSLMFGNNNFFFFKPFGELNKQTHLIMFLPISIVSSYRSSCEKSVFLDFGYSIYKQVFGYEALMVQCTAIYLLEQKNFTTNIQLINQNVCNVRHTVFMHGNPWQRGITPTN
jgi:hypothetical protein